MNYNESGRGPSSHIHRSTDGIDPPKPLGKNLTEGGFYSGEEANASYGTDMGGKRDPGRVALNQFEESNAAGRGPGSGSKQSGIEVDQGGFERLGGDAEA